MDAISTLLDLPEREKREKGLLYTPREIFQQPATWATSYQIFSSRRAQIEDFLQLSGVGVDSNQPPIVFLIGAGTSDYIGRSLTHLLRRKWRCEVLAVASTDLLTNLDDWILSSRRYLWVSFSRSGDSPEGVALLQSALDCFPKIRHLIVCCNKNGQMIKQFSDHPAVFCHVLNEQVNDHGLAMTSSFSNMVITGHCLAHIKTPAEYGAVFERLYTMGESFLGRAANLTAQLAAEAYARVCFLGTGSLNAVALESALKVLELTAGRMHTMAESSLGIRHGPLSALDDQTLVVSYVSGDRRRRGYDLDLLAELRGKKLGKKLVAILPQSVGWTEQPADGVIALEAPDGFMDDYRPPADVMFGQLLGLFSSLRHQLKPDTPSPNGAISRVVSQVNIH